MTTTVVLGRDDYAKSPVEKIAYIRCVVEAFRDGATISAKRRRIYAAQALAYMDDIIGAIAASRIQGSEAPLPPGPWEFCRDCGARMMWSDPDVSAPSWMCPRCVYYRMVRAEGAAPRAVEGTLREALEYAVGMSANGENVEHSNCCAALHLVGARARAALSRREP